MKRSEPLFFCSRPKFFIRITIRCPHGENVLQSEIFKLFEVATKADPYTLCNKIKSYSIHIE